LLLPRDDERLGRKPTSWLSSLEVVANKSLR
jgi:hypothetical protein